MINLEHQLTIDDLIVAYIIEKTRQGYIPEVTEQELMEFIKYFTQKKEVLDLLPDYNQLITRFLDRKIKHDWRNTEPHIKFTEEGILKPTNHLSCYDESIITPYFMGLNEKKEINNYISEYLSKYPKRELDISNIENINILEECNLASAIIMECIWHAHLKYLMHSQKWPNQCKDIFKYLLDEDLATKIELKSIKGNLINFYEDFSKINSLLLQSDPKLCISKDVNCFLPYANYQLIKNAYQDTLFKEFCNPYGMYGANYIEIDYSKSLVFDKSHQKINFKKSKHAKKLVKKLDEIS